MQVTATALYEALNAFGRVEKTVTIQEMAVTIDKAAGTERTKKQKVSHHAVVKVIDDEESESVTVDIDKLKKFAKSFGKQTIVVYVHDHEIYFKYIGGGCSFYDMRVSSMVELHLTDLTKGGDAVPTL